MKRYPEFPASTGALEEEVLARWRAEDTFRRSVEATKDGEPFVFYEGPPTANGRPGLHHMFARTVKDAVARFRTMQGRHVPRVAGWDTHGLPVEIEAERRLEISGKREIEAYGIAEFNRVCRESVLEYRDVWEAFSARMGYWLDYARPYVTYHRDYIESVWWLLAEIDRRGLFYRGFKIIPYCPRCGTGLSSHEVAQGYRDVLDPSLHFSVPVVGEDGAEDGRELLVWTTTPWTLVSNVALAVSPSLEYAEVAHEGRRYVLARSRVAALFGSEEGIVRSLRPEELVGLRYRRPFDWVEPRGASAESVAKAWRVYAADFVSGEDGTGIVHTAPAFGADDFAMGQAHGLPMLQPLDERGAFRAGVPVVGGTFVKDADGPIVAELKGRGQVFRNAREMHSYPHCWRCGSPLLYMARDSWFIRTTAVREALLANQATIAWHPPEVGSGRFGEWLENNVDWAISRSRYWGTPLPAWVCDRDPSHVEFVGSFAALAERAGPLPEDFDPHRPFIDAYEWPCACGGTKRRTPEVIDVWFDSGAMPFAQHHYPFENREAFDRAFPADFIAEGVDQTRGWFYSLLAIATLVGREAPYRHVIVNEQMLDASGLKMSKTRRNTVDPFDAMAEFGADAVRWYVLSVSNPWVPKRFDPKGIREVQGKTFATLRETYRFFALYANLEGWAPSEADPAPADRPEIDRWLRSETAALVARVTEALEGYDLTRAVRAVSDFVLNDLSNWYVRRSRPRFWRADDAGDQRAAFATLHGALSTVARLMAPVAPFVADWLHRALHGADASVHLAGFPAADADAADAADDGLRAGMEAVRGLANLGRAAREDAGIRVRQPLARVFVVLPPAARAALHESLLAVLRDELNVKRVEIVDRAEELVSYAARPNFRALGARYGKATPRVAEAVRGMDGAAIAAFLAAGEAAVTVDGETVALRPGDLEVTVDPRGDLLTKSDGTLTVALDPALTPGLRAEGLAREVVNRVQNLRRESGLEVADRIRLGVFGPAALAEAVEAHRGWLADEVLAVAVEVGEAPAPDAWEARRDVDLDGTPAVVALARVAPAPGPPDE